MPLVAGVVAVGLIAAVFFLIRGVTASGAASVDGELLYDVVRDDLKITVVESGSLESEKTVDLKSELEGRVQILRLVEEGTFAKKGQLLAELDAADLVEREISQRISFERASASLTQARKNYEIEKSNGESDIKQAELTVRFGEIDLEKYLKGDWIQAQLEATNDIGIAEEELKRAEDKRSWSERLAGKGYITRQELEADELNVKKRQVDLELSKGRQRVLVEYTHPKEVERLQSDLDEAKKNLGRVISRVEGQMAQAEANLKEKESTFDLEKERLEKLQDQIGKAKIYAPQDGLVVYRNESNFGRGNEEPIREGATVRERQTIIVLPDVTQMMAKIKIHESSYDRVSPGQKAEVTLDAFPDKIFPAIVTFVAPLPDSQSWWMNPDLKVYSAEVRLGGDTTMLKPGMSCSVEIEVADLDDVLFVPIQAVFRKGNTTYCYVKTSSGVVAKPVKLGLHNDRLIHVTEGLEKGDRVYLVPPPNAHEIAVPEVETTSVPTPAEEDFPEYTPRVRVMPGPQASVDGERPGGESAGGMDFQGMMNMSPEDRAKALQDYMKKSPEEQQRIREQMMRGFEQMPEEQREALRRRFEQGGGGGERGPGGERGDRGPGMGSEERRGSGEGRRPSGEGRRPPGEERPGGGSQGRENGGGSSSE